MEHSNIDNRHSTLIRSVIIWGILALVLSYFMITKNNSHMVIHASQWEKVLAFFVAAITATIGALIGDAIRLFALPDGFFTNGGMTSIISTKLFWLFGPQLIGLFIGCSTGVALVLQ